MSNIENKQHVAKANIHWFPGHMAKARREIEEKVKLVDIVIEIVDGRVPYSSKNPMIDQLVKSKKRLIVASKKDLADPSRLLLWKAYYEQLGMSFVAVNLQENQAINQIKNACLSVLEEVRAKDAKRGLKPRAIRAMVLGVPNVGKSTLINRIAKRKATVVGNRPGVTKSQQWIRVGNDFELLDTPGILWPKFESQTVALHLALSGAIKDSILPKDELAIYGLKLLSNIYPNLVMARYKSLFEKENTINQYLTSIGEVFGLFTEGGFVNIDRVIDFVLKDIRDGLIGQYTLEIPQDLEVKENE